MIFAQYGYKNYHNGNSEAHPIKSWAKMVSDNQRYCMKNTWIKALELRLWLIVGRVSLCELPSFHWYWKEQSKKEIKSRLKILVRQYEECKKNPDRIKYLFNANTTLSHLESRINTYKFQLK